MPRTWRSSARCIASTGTRCRVTTSGPTPGREHESAGHAFGRTNGGSGQRRAEPSRAIQAPPAKLSNLTNPVTRAVNLRSVFERLVDRTVLGRCHPELGTCWVFTGPADPYGRIGKGSERFVHRLGWKQLRGPIPDGMELHHRCGVHACSLPTPRIWHTDARRTASAGTRCQVPTYGSTQGLARGAAVSAMPNDSERFASARRRTSDDCGATEHRR